MADPTTMKPAGEDQTRLILRRHYGAIACYYCKGETHVYQNCPERPCYLCKKQGHIASYCPFREGTADERKPSKKASHGEDVRHRRESTYNRPDRDLNPHHFTRLRELTSSSIPLPSLPLYESLKNASILIQADSFHTARVTAAEWAPDGSFIVSGDKRGLMNIWPIGSGISSRLFEGCNFDLSKVKTAASLPTHRCIIYTFAFNPNNQQNIFTCSGDGTVCVTNVDVSCSGKDGGHGQSSSDILFDFNPNGWQTPSTWRMASSLAYDVERKSVYCGSSDGTIVRADARMDNIRTSNSECISRGRFHSDKVTNLAINPVQPYLMASASNDKHVSLWDIRKFIPGNPLGTFAHDRVVSSAFFSPNSGRKLLTTSHDNRIRVWDDIHAFQGDANAFTDSLPSTTIVHSHDFHRYLTPFRATWDPMDWTDDRFICGRFLGEALVDPNDSSDQGIMLRPIDIFSAKEKKAVLSLTDRNGTLIFTINRFSPAHNAILSAASKSLFIWSTKPIKDENRRDGQSKSLIPRGTGDGNEDDNDDTNDDGGGDGGTGGSVRAQKKRKISLAVSKKTTSRTPRTNKK